MTIIPPNLLGSIANAQQSVVLVMGAGCSYEAPTCLPLGGPLSNETHRKLLEDKVLDHGECTDPWNLSELASLVYNKTGSQSDMVSRFPLNRMKTARPNRGHSFLAALMSEGAISYVLSLNYDFAVQNALIALGLGDKVDSIEVSGATVSAKASVIHLHGSVNSDHEGFILRTEVMDEAWKDQWEQMIATQVLAAPVILFAGLGSSAPVLTNTVAMIQGIINNVQPLYQSDIGDIEQNTFSDQLGILPENYIQAGWCDTMHALADRLKNEQIHNLDASGCQILKDNGETVETVQLFHDTINKLKPLNLLDLGKFRSNLLMDSSYEYLPSDMCDSDHKVQPLTNFARQCSNNDAEILPSPGGVWGIQKDGQSIGKSVIVSGRGVSNMLAIEHKIKMMCDNISTTTSAPASMVIVGGVMDDPSVGDMVDIINGEYANDLVDGPAAPLVLSSSSLDMAEKMKEWFDGC